MCKCHECNICLHTFKCSCTDNLIKLNICKHIHACMSLFFQNSECTDVNNRENNSTSAVKDILGMNKACQSQQQPAKTDIINW